MILVKHAKKLYLFKDVVKYHFTLMLRSAVLASACYLQKMPVADVKNMERFTLRQYQYFEVAFLVAKTLRKLLLIFLL